jgi:RimJ/RimL family protein N-acetyltransferase
MLYGERVRLRRPERADLPRFAAWLNDPEVRAHLALIYPMGLAHEERWFEQQLQAEPATQAFVIEARAEGAAAADPGAAGEWQPVGVCGYHTVDWRNRSGELGLFIGEKARWGAGLGEDAVRTLARWGLRQLNLHRVQLRVFEDNAPAIRCYEKVGFRCEGRLRQDRFQDGRYLDTLVMGLLRDELPD